MMKKIFIVALISSIILADVAAQPNLPWHGKKAAVVITYDCPIHDRLLRFFSIHSTLIAWMQKNRLYKK